MYIKTLSNPSRGIFLRAPHGKEHKCDTNELKKILTIISTALTIEHNITISEDYRNRVYQRVKASIKQKCKRCFIQHNWASPRQTSQLHSGRRYVSSCYFKLQNMKSGHSYLPIFLMAAVKNSHSGKTSYKMLSKILMQQVKYGWTEIGGDFNTNSGETSAEIYIQMDPALNFLLDQCSLKELPTDNSWKSEANARINKLRKAPVTINIADTHGGSGYSIELVQMKKDFAFGTAIHMSYMTDSSKKAYQDFVYNNFEWAVPENAMKWRLMEWTKGREKYDWMSALNALLSHGIKVRGHNMFWAVDDHVPAWLNGLSQSQIVAEMKRHVTNMISHTKGKLQHWDVNNENLHGDYFERHTGNPDITNDMFSWIHNLDPNVKLFLNEFNVATWTECTTALKDQALHMKKAGVPLYGIGVQGHFSSSNIDMTTLKYRLDKVAEAGLPIWITELTIKEQDENKKAAALEDVLTLFYSHPAIEGVLLWGFWDGAIYDTQLALANGPNVTPNAAGRKYQNLMKNTWKTYINSQISTSHNVHSNVFMGDYLLNVKHNGQLIHQENFHVGKSGKSLTIHLQGDTIADIFIQMDPTLNFLLDQCSLKELQIDTSWKSKAIARINKVRKSPITIKIKVRGHNMFWGVDSQCPAWLKNMNHSQIVSEMKRHVNSMISHTKGKLQHWDVNNENLHGDFYERYTGNPDVTNDMFTWIHKLEPNVQLFLNEYNVATLSECTTAVKNQALHMKKVGVPLHGIGVQGHFHNSNIDMTTLKYRLDKVAETGLPIWITELTIKEPDENKKASALENVLTLFFSHPAVEGVLLWGFWDGAIYDTDVALANGPNVAANAAGRKYQQLINQSWKSNVNSQMSTNHNVHSSVFRGDYLLNVKHNGRLIHQDNFHVGKSGKSLTINLQGNSSLFSFHNVYLRHKYLVNKR
ncbi:hypothetical protein FSP39_003248 [Pinctada imbricata]|uniref:GH10 domain-containing protein n=1 Tax=Pinctada imbricata TaxID=66713 RepID=A0AA88XEG2_PINIB|nr:hypothetical protein FSP39_003248 [Pinctada imbricata]